MEFNRIIKLLRKERGITQKQAAEDLGVSQALLSHYEKGTRLPPQSPDLLFRTRESTGGRPPAVRNP